ncbi:WD40-repeat-containing domain protein [Dipodascopsis tothii]|uniref:WD40-repeat-containing domain protein n=1 Tax=Dipodascopsis tothii TaxID=44089 RepID=UPI0034CDA570
MHEADAAPPARARSPRARADDSRRDGPVPTVARFTLAPTTKTTVVTTTTTTTTTFPPVVIRPPRYAQVHAEREDMSQYPLADAPTPSTLRRFNVEIDGQVTEFREADEPEESLQSLALTMRALQATARPAARDECTPASRKRAASPDDEAKPAKMANITNLDMANSVLLNKSNKRRATEKDRLEGARGSAGSSPALAAAPAQLTPDVENNPIGLERRFSHDKSPGRRRGEGSSSRCAAIAPPPLQLPQNPLSLPSPSLSPVTGALRHATSYFDGDAAMDDAPAATNENLDLVRSLMLHGGQADADTTVLTANQALLMEIPAIMETFDSLPASVQNYIVYQILRRCNKKTLSMVAEIVMPALRCDFLTALPLELSMHIISYLDIHSLCAATQVSRAWRDIIDSSEFTWKKLLQRDGFELEQDEVSRAVSEGWSLEGWSTAEETAAPPSSPAGSPAASEASPARDSPAPDAAARSDESATEATVSKNLYKSIYRRHYVINRNWMSPNSQPKHLSFAGHGHNVVTCLQFDSKKIITGSDDMCINVYDTETGKTLTRLKGHAGGVWALQYVGNTLVSGSTDRTVRVWDLEEGRCTHIFYGHTSTVRCLQILMPVRTGTTSDGKAIMEPKFPIIVTGSRDSSLRVWRLPTADDAPYLPTQATDDDGPFFMKSLVGHQHSVRAISGHGDTLVSGSYDTFVRVWKISTGECVWRLGGHGAKVYSVVIDPKRKRCVSGSMDWLVKVWSLETGTCLYTLEGHTSLVGLLDLNRTSLVSAAADSTLRVWNPETGMFMHKLEGHTGAITCFQHDEYKVISGSDRALKLWNIKTGKVVKDILSDLNRVWQVRFDDRRCVAAVQRGNNTFIEVLNFDYDPSQT